ncbi:hypothetical protein SCATT_24240 [Streptantibioticus cattleyicolor NRRL 8057 = DSM 46488]|uniref:Uncharacterized protein n=1 Tax=Streptantibioticus cattleyicolor (strain ATCC 35852 / DSM 46488 / JCM 4925 / NBRC 14057 / NRRL 8057) TaxID=1003195 RepID=G8WS35_STREN|nr:hypothetical protein SCATT_24240 [Streptantibioticus cattleyicolor NRRL 8057 = DSM 46488]
MMYGTMPGCGSVPVGDCRCREVIGSVAAVFIAGTASLTRGSALRED